ncbi:gliding motility-associated C-terminal domain-containing protein [Arenibacter sp. GZD96]|uniref:Ig-like domain-containing protein n=1 Tax=Aurantibrevibacter litoralis TaxID=3106030 RepID=UPI002AFE5645|nr:gliding motility-associated C-terminal domain-containing protein [Arenibacter sp. GZD-96]MEA1786474.1 gliding motility-associated C-terminal domain-containing protein [Arenibacter sp. GZD-96]
MKTKLLLKNSVISFMLLFAMGHGIAQTLNKPTPADNPNQAGNSIWSAACASASFNEYFVDFTWNTPLVNSANTFILELSDANGTFSNPVELARDNTKNTSFNFAFSFSLPTDTRGEGYRLRVRSTSPAITGAVSDPLPMYFIDFNSPLLISPNGNGSIPSGGSIQLCDGNNVTLAPHNIANPNTYQYNWYRSGTLLSEKGPSITVSQSGIYSVELDYGSICSTSANTLSNDITISEGNSLGVAINMPSSTNLCPGETVNLIANITGQGLTYTWYKDGIAITAPAVNNDTFTVDASVAGFEGNYQVEINGSGTCLERSTPLTITNAGNFTVARDNSENIMLLPGDTKVLAVSTSSPSVTYQWFRDNVAISGATANSLSVTQVGTYYAEVTLTGGSCTATSRTSPVTTVVAPTALDISITYGSPYTDCTNTDIVLGVGTITAVLANNDILDVTTDLVNRLTYQWTKNGTPVAGATTSNISLTSIDENGQYELNASLDTFTPVSNTLPVQLLVNETLTINSTSFTTCNPSDFITISSSMPLNGESFEWYLNDTLLDTSSTSLNVSASGRYRLVVSRNGCPLNSNEIVISPFDESLITLDTPTEVVFPEGNSRTINASGGTAYRWYDINNVLLSSTSSLTITEEGSYMLVANIDACEITKQITATFLDTFKVPNVITVNGDGLNDQWVLPNSFSRNADISIIIYNDRGEEVFNQSNYQNNWPESTTSFPRQNMVFFYKIRNAGQILKQGTITVIR